MKIRDDVRAYIEAIQTLEYIAAVDARRQRVVDRYLRKTVPVRGFVRMGRRIKPHFRSNRTQK